MRQLITMPRAWLAPAVQPVVQAAMGPSLPLRPSAQRDGPRIRG